VKVFWVFLTSLSAVPAHASPFFERSQVWTEVQILQSRELRNLVGWQFVSIPWITSLGLGAESATRSPEILALANITHTVTGLWVSGGTGSAHWNLAAGWSLVGLERNHRGWQFVLRLPISLFAIPR
jgi:hypothetical protein